MFMLRQQNKYIAKKNKALDTRKTYRILIVENDVGFLKLFQMVLFDLIQSYGDLQFVFEFSDQLDYSYKAGEQPVSLIFINSEHILHDDSLLNNLTETNPNMCIAVLISDQNPSRIHQMMKKLNGAPEKLVVGHILKSNITPGMLKATCMGFIDTMLSNNGH